jgi:hypothetical protein
MRMKRAALKRQSFLLQAADAAFSSIPSSRASVASTASNSSALASCIDLSKQRGMGSAASMAGKSESRKALLRSSAVFETAGLASFQPAARGVSFPPTTSEGAEARTPKSRSCVHQRRASLSKTSKKSPSPGSKKAETLPTSAQSQVTPALFPEPAVSKDPLSVFKDPPHAGREIPAGEHVGREIPAGRNRNSYINDLVHIYAHDSNAQQPTVGLTRIINHYLEERGGGAKEIADTETKRMMLTAPERETVSEGEKDLEAGVALKPSYGLTHILSLYTGADPSDVVEQPQAKPGLTQIIRMYVDEGTDVEPLARQQSPPQQSPSSPSLSHAGLPSSDAEAPEQWQPYSKGKTLNTQKQMVSCRTAFSSDPASGSVPPCLSGATGHEGVGADQGLDVSAQHETRKDAGKDAGGEGKVRPSQELMGSYSKKRDSLISQLVELYLPPTSLDKLSNPSAAASSQPRALPAAPTLADAMAIHSTAHTNALEGGSVQVADLQVDDDDRRNSSIYEVWRNAGGVSVAETSMRSAHAHRTSVPGAVRIQGLQVDGDRRRSSMWSSLATEDAVPRLRHGAIATHSAARVGEQDTVQQRLGRNSEEEKPAYSDFAGERTYKCPRT